MGGEGCRSGCGKKDPVMGDDEGPEKQIDFEQPPKGRSLLCLGVCLAMNCNCRFCAFCAHTMNMWGLMSSDVGLTY